MTDGTRSKGRQVAVAPVFSCVSCQAGVEREQKRNVSPPSSNAKLGASLRDRLRRETRRQTSNGMEHEQGQGQGSWS